MSASWEVIDKRLHHALAFWDFDEIQQAANTLVTSMLISPIIHHCSFLLSNRKCQHHVFLAGNRNLASGVSTLSVTSARTARSIRSDLR